MTNRTKPMTTHRPAAFLGVTEFGDRLRERTAELVTQRTGTECGHLQFLPFVDMPIDRLTEALTAAMNVRQSDAVRDGSNAPPIRAPQVWLLASALEIENRINQLRQIAKRARQEFRRSCLQGSVGLFLHVGPIGNQLPSDELLARLESEFSNFDQVMIVADTDARGQRWRAEDLLENSARSLCHLLIEDCIQRVLSSGRSPGIAGLNEVTSRCWSVGMSRVDISDTVLRSFLRSSFRNQFFEHLIGTNQAGPDNREEEPRQRASVGIAGSVFRSTGGSLAAVERTMFPVAQTTSVEWRRAQLIEAAEQTRRALAELLPRAAAPPIGFWRWLWGLIMRFVRWLLRISPHAISTDILEGDRKKKGDELQRLLEVESFRVRLKQFELAMRPEYASDSNGRPHPLEFAAGDQPDVRTDAHRGLPDISKLAWAFARDTSLPSLLAESEHPELLRAKIDAMCDRELKLDQRGSLIRPEHFRDLVLRASRDVRSLFPTGGEQLHKFVILPSSLRETIAFEEFEPSIGSDGEVVFLALQQGVRFSTLFTAEDNNHVVEPHEHPAA